MKKLLLPVCLCMSFMSAMAQNSLLQNPTTGAITPNAMTNIHMVSDGTDVVLVAGDKTAIYAIDIADNDPADAVANTVTSIPDFIAMKLNPVAGQTVTVKDIEVNPISKAVYVLATGGANTYIFKVENNGANITLIDLSNTTYSKLTWGGNNLSVNDIAYGNNTLYVTSGTFSLDGEIGWIAPPFTHNASIATRATTLFKSNWGGQYSTTAPLESLTFGNVDGVNRLMGVTTCAPGFSIDASTLSGSGLLSVTEDFNVHQGFTQKVAFMHHDSKDWLFDLHDNKLYRVGKKYLDGSQVAANQYNNSAKKLRDNSGSIPAAIPASEMKLMSNATYQTIAYWDNYRLLTLESSLAGGALKLEQMSTETPPPTAVKNIANVGTVALYPNPATNIVTVSLPQGESNATLNILSINGSVMLTQALNANKATVNVDQLSSGIYTVNVLLKDGQRLTNKLTIK